MVVKKLISFLKQRPYRIVVLIGADAILLACSAALSFLIRFEGVPPPEFLSSVLILVGLNIIVTIPICYWQRLYHISLSFFSIRDLYRLLKATLLASTLILTTVLILKDTKVIPSFPRASLIINFLFVTMFLSALRIGKRMTREFRSFQTGKRVLIIGADDAGEQLARKMLTLPTVALIGFLDDRGVKRHTTIHGIPVLGDISDLSRIISKHDIQECIVTEHRLVKATINHARSQNLNISMIKILPSIDDIIDGKLVLANIRDVSIEDLLGRQPVQIDTNLMRSFLQGKRVLVTGAAGSIGSTLCKHIAGFQPQLLIALDQNETGIFYLERNLKAQFPNLSIKPIIADVCHSQRISAVFAEYRPEIVFHAAAYKHVSIMEEHPLEAVKNNIFGTLSVAQNARTNGVDICIFISSDKAVRPVSVMGATKHIGEKICRMLHAQGTTRFCAVRFGNVLDSQGNVIEIFREQIKKGGPLEITHPEMQRYFMVTSEACLLLMQAAALSRDGEIFCLDMGKPVKVYDLAKEMIRLAGYEPDKDIQILFSRPRRGERLSEELLVEGEIPTRYEKIFIARRQHSDDLLSLPEKLEQLKSALHLMDEKRAIALLEDIAPEYSRSNNAPV